MKMNRHRGAAAGWVVLVAVLAVLVAAVAWKMIAEQQTSPGGNTATTMPGE